MKALLLLLGMFLLLTAAYAQNKVCTERGHIWIYSPFTTLMATWDYTVDLPDKTIRVHHDPNVITGSCERCGTGYSSSSKPDTTVVWERPKQKPKPAINLPTGLIDHTIPWASDSAYTARPYIRWYE